MIERSEVIIDCPDPAALARFYAGLFGTTPEIDSPPGWAAASHQGLQLAFQPVDDYKAPKWPGQERGQQFHLDFFVDDFEAEGARALELGAIHVESHIGENGYGYVVYLDPAGHPFCLCRQKH